MKKPTNRKTDLVLVKFDVTDQDIATAGHSCYSCPVACVINRRLKPRYEASVNNAIITIAVKRSILAAEQVEHASVDYEACQIVTPREVGQFVVAYDSYPYHRRPERIGFELDIPDRYLLEVA